jgi:NADP-dependent 3-hydroxy acid dehydrogenase YdfG
MLENETFLVTGATSGIGLSATRALASLGASIILLGRNKKKLESLYDEIAVYSQPTICHFNLANAVADDYIALTRSLHDKTLSGLVHCASHFDKLTPLHQLSMVSWHQTMQVNLNARFLLTKSLLAQLKKAKKARVIFLRNLEMNGAGNPLWGAYQVAEKASYCLAEQFQAELNHSRISLEVIDIPPCNTSQRQKAYPFEDKSSLTQVDDLVLFWQNLFNNEQDKEPLVRAEELN